MANQSFFSKLFAFKFVWIGKLFHNANKPFLQTVIDITNAVKKGLSIGAIDFITSLTPTNLDNELVAIARKEVSIILADELLIQTSGAPTTEADAQDLAKKLVDSFGLLSDADKEELYTSVAARLYIFLQAHKNGQKITFGQGAALVEGFYEDWLAAQK